MKFVGLTTNSPALVVAAIVLRNQKDWQGQPGLNRRPAVLETAALPTELYPFEILAAQRATGTGGFIFNLPDYDKR